MIEDTVLTQFCVAPIDPEKIVLAEENEKAYSLKSVQLGICKSEEDEKAKLEAAKPTQDTIGFALETEVDMNPSWVETFTADKQPLATFKWGEHAPGEDKYQEESIFKPGEKVLCVVYQGYNAVIPAIVEGPLTEKYLREMYKTDDDLQIGYESADEVIEAWLDWDWDSMIVRPLVRLDDVWGGMKETILVPRVYIFPYKTF